MDEKNSIKFMKIFYRNDVGQSDINFSTLNLNAIRNQ
jgi:hypothetical protein